MEYGLFETPRKQNRFELPRVQENDKWGWEGDCSVPVEEIGHEHGVRFLAVASEISPKDIQGHQRSIKCLRKQPER